MKIVKLFTCALMLLGMTGSLACAANKKAYTDPAEAGPDFKVQGEYVGQIQGESGQEKWGAQVIARGEGRFDVVGYRGGLPGAGWDGSEKQFASGQRSGNLTTAENEHVTLTIEEGVMTISSLSGDELGKLEKIERKGPTLGQKAPEGTVVLFDGTSTDNWAKGRMTDEGLLMQGAVSKLKHQDATLHVEFLLPFMPNSRGQARGNSGLYVQGRYEIQMLDSFGLEGKDNECGGIYQASAPKVNMCLPPLSWQTYDVDFTAAKFDDTGKKTKNARITVRHNGVVIHDDLELPSHTPGGVSQEIPEPGPVFLQDHGDPVRYRNIWVVEKQ